MLHFTANLLKSSLHNHIVRFRHIIIYDICQNILKLFVSNLAHDCFQQENLFYTIEHTSATNRSLLNAVCWHKWGLSLTGICWTVSLQWYKKMPPKVMSWLSVLDWLSYLFVIANSFWPHIDILSQTIILMFILKDSLRLLTLRSLTLRLSALRNV